MDETLSHPPPCLCCRSVGEEGPHLARRWNTAFEHDGYVDLFQEGISQPRGWIHRSCLCEFVLHNATRTADGETKIDKICIVCEVRLRTAETLPTVGPAHQNSLGLGPCGLHESIRRPVSRRTTQPGRHTVTKSTDETLSPVAMTALVAPTISAKLPPPG
jgi:hypothetical protein